MESETPVYRSVTYIRKKVPNSRDVYDQPVKDKDRKRFSEIFAAFDKGEDAPLNGTPLEQWPKLDVTQVETLKAAKIFTVQALAEIHDASLHRLPGGYRGLIVEAQKWLNQGQELKELKAQNEELLKRLEALESKDPVKKPGRPKKAA